jgi:hypothetical protein
VGRPFDTCCYRRATMSEKTIEGFLRVDWKKEKITGRKTEPNASELGANEILVPVEINVTFPETEVPTLSVDVEAPTARVEAGELESIPADEQPGWTDVVEELVAERESDIEDTETPEEIKEIVKSITATTLIDAPGRPKAEHVSDYTHECVMELMEVEDV